MQPITNDVRMFKGIKNDEDAKQVSLDYLTQIVNFNFPDTGVLGLARILLPFRVNVIGSSTIDGLFEFRYLNSSNTLVTEYIAVTDGKIYKGATTTEVLLKSGLTAGLASFATFNDKLFIANGLNYVNVYWAYYGVVSEMGAPAAELTGTAGNVDVGAHYYAMTYLTAGGEEILGSISNTVTVASSAKQVILHFPVGYAGTLTRKIYRTLAAGSTLKLLATISNNTDIAYTDNIADATITGLATIPATNNELPKPYHLSVAGQALYGAKVTKFPTQIFKTDTNLEVWDVAAYIDISNYGNDNTAIQGIGVDFGKILVGTSKNIYIVEPSDTVVGVSTVKPSRANVGMKNGYTVRSIPAFGDFQGGLMFVSTLNDVRLMSGIQDIPVATVFDNIRTENWAQNIRGTLNGALNASTYVYAEYYNYRYHLVVDDIKYVFDIRTQGWTNHVIRNDTDQSRPRVLAVMNNLLYNGQPDGGIEQEYSKTTYASQRVTATLTSPFIAVNTKYKYLQKFIMWFKSGLSSTINITTILDENDMFPITGTVTLTGGVFNSTYFNSSYFLTSSGAMDYRIVNINAPCRWLQYTLDSTFGGIEFQGFGFIGNLLNEK